MGDWIKEARKATAVMDEGIPKVEQAMEELLGRKEVEPVDHEGEHMAMGAWVKHLREDHGMPAEAAEALRQALSGMICAQAQGVRDRRTLIKSVKALAKTQRTQAKYLSKALDRIEAQDRKIAKLKKAKAKKRKKK